MRVLVAAALLLPLGSFAQGKFTQAASEGKDLYATLDTTQGQIVIRLFSQAAPRAVANFVGLASGEKEFTDPRTGRKARRPYFNGLIFHRVIPDFMVQGGDPLGTGQGGPGYTFQDEFQSGRTFDKVGLLAMANSGAGTNGSQFFITTSTPQGLNNKHTIFGEVVSGYEAVLAISQVARNDHDRPYTDQVMKKVTITEKAPPPRPQKKDVPAKAQKQ